MNVTVRGTNYMDKEIGGDGPLDYIHCSIMCLRVNIVLLIAVRNS